ncbi:MAG: hypothetical protein NVV74_08790 [Magnetospirillum sp.]|nr:hypothetical protein [Magnetospirillum sp.]
MCHALSCLALGLFLSACEHPLQLGEYRFQALFERDPTAYRNGGGAYAEPLAIAVKLQNLSGRSIYLADPPQDHASGQASEGLYVRASLVTPVHGIGAPVVDPGTRSGRNILAESDASRTPWFDPHTRTVENLATAGGELLKLNPDSIRSSLGLMGNEALVTLLFPVDWSMVSASHPFVRTSVPVRLELGYRDPDGTFYAFPGRLERNVEAVLSNGRRYASGMLAAPNGPVSGEFRRTEAP